MSFANDLGALAGFQKQAEGATMPTSNSSTPQARYKRPVKSESEVPSVQPTPEASSSSSVIKTAPPKPVAPGTEWQPITPLEPPSTRPWRNTLVNASPEQVQAAQVYDLENIIERYHPGVVPRGQPGPATTTYSDGTQIPNTQGYIASYNPQTGEITNSVMFDPRFSEEMRRARAREADLRRRDINYLGTRAPTEAEGFSPEYIEARRIMQSGALPMTFPSSERQRLATGVTPAEMGRMAAQGREFTPLPANPAAFGSLAASRIPGIPWPGIPYRAMSVPSYLLGGALAGRVPRLLPEAHIQYAAPTLAGTATPQPEQKPWYRRAINWITGRQPEAVEYAGTQNNT